MVKQNSVQVLLSTFNGSRFLSQQLESLVLQDYPNLSIIIRDDGSTDNTVEVINDFISLTKADISLVLGNNIGSSQSFYELLNISNADFVMFCDQDDYWLPTKVSETLNKIANKDQAEPMAVFTDLYVTNSELEILSDSMLKNDQKMKPSYLLKKPLFMVAQNPVAGCTMLINRSAKILVLEYGKIPNGLLHDHCFSSIINLFGSVYYLDKPTIYYRQHGLNQVGGLHVGTSYFFDKLKSIYSTIEHDLTLLKYINMKGFGIKCKYVFFKLYLNFLRLIKP